MIHKNNNNNNNNQGVFLELLVAAKNFGLASFIKDFEEKG